MNREESINFIIFGIGLILSLLGQVPSMPEAAKAIFVGIGCSVIASSIVAYLTYIYSLRNAFADQVTEKLGLEDFLFSQFKLLTTNSSVKKAILNVSEQMDLIGYSLRSIKINYGDLIEEKVRKGLQIRIIAVNPKSIAINDVERYRNLQLGLKELNAWVDSLKKNAPDKEKVQLKFINSLIQDLYLRADNHIFITPFTVATDRKHITYKFRESTEGFSYYSDAFEEMWENKSQFVVEE